MTKALLAPLAAAALLPVAASAFPDGAPWNAFDDRDAACASCHFGSDPVVPSDALTVEGIEAPLYPGETYAITLRFAPDGGRTTGFLAAFRPEIHGGSIMADDGLETRESSVRSVAAVPLGENGTAWIFAWTAPASAGRVVLHVAANAANDDASPFGDVVHLGRFEFEVAPASE